MKTKQRLLVLLAVVMMLAALPLTVFGAANVIYDGPAAGGPMPSALTLFVGEKYQLSVPTSKKVKWKSGKTYIATVTQKGLVTAKKAGKTTIKATVGKKKYKCKLTVLKPYGAYVVQAGVYGWQYNLAKQFIRVRDYVPDAYWTYNSGTYTIIAGTFSDLGNAVRRRNYLLNNGISASVEYR